MGYLTYTQAEVEGMIGRVAIETFDTIQHIRQVVEFVTSLGDPLTVLTGLGFTTDQANRIIAAYGSQGLLRLADLFEGKATLTTSTNLSANVKPVIGPALY